MNDEPKPKPPRLPIRSVHEPPIHGPHEIVGEEGVTRHLVFGGPNAGEIPGVQTPPAPEPIGDDQLAPFEASLRRRLALRILGWLMFPISMVVAGLGFLAFLSLTWTGRGSVVIGVAMVALLARWVIRRARRGQARE